MMGDTQGKRRLLRPLYRTRVRVAKREKRSCELTITASRTIEEETGREQNRGAGGTDRNSTKAHDGARKLRSRWWNKRHNRRRGKTEEGKKGRQTKSLEEHMVRKGGTRGKQVDISRRKHGPSRSIGKRRLT